MTVTIDSADKRSAKALALLARAHTWTHGRRKCDGLRFAIVAGSKPGSTYMVSQLGCTCADANRRGAMCKHQVAYRLWTIQQNAAGWEPAAADVGLGLCTDAELAETMLQIKATHLVRDADRAERAAYRARLRADLGMIDEAAA